MKSNLLVYDVGSTYTKATAFFLEGDDLSFVGRAQAPTSLTHVQGGLDAACAALEKRGVRFTSDVSRYSTCSAAGGLRMVAVGFMPRVTGKAAKEVAMNAGARVLEVLSRDDNPEYRLQVLKEIRPDIILLAGGTDGGDTASAEENAEIIIRAALSSIVIVACNKEAQLNVRELFERASVPHIIVPNVMPTIHELNVHAARAAIHEQFIRQITYAKGLGDLQNTLTDKKVMPTPGAVLLATELLSRGTYREKGIGSLMVLDVGGATTDVHSVMPYLDELKTEERGLVVNNEKQASYRTVEGNLGMRVSATGIVDAAGPLALAKRAGDGCEEMQEKIRQYAGMLEKNPEHLAQDEKERRIDIAMAATALEVAMKRHAGILSQRFDPVLGIIPGYPMGRDLRSVEKVIAVGGIFTYSDDIVRQEILTEAFAAPGISLLPEAPQFAVDDKYFLYAMGVLSQYIPDAVLKLAKKYFAWRRPPG